MKRTLSLFAFVAICSVMAMSCKCSSNTPKEPTQEEIQQQKQALADTVLAKIDEFAQQYWDNCSKSFKFRALELTDAEKRVKPDYLLDPSVAATLVTRTQKINALAIYEMEQAIRKIYDMPCEEVEEVIAKLIIDISFPISKEVIIDDSPASEKIKAYYKACKESGDLTHFWQYEDAYGTELNYLLVQNPDLFFGRMTEEQWLSFYNIRKSCFNAINELAKYDEEMSLLQKFEQKEWTISNADADRVNSNFTSAKEYRIAHKDLYIAKRNALLQ